MVLQSIGLLHISQLASGKELTFRPMRRQDIIIAPRYRGSILASRIPGEVPPVGQPHRIVRSRHDTHDISPSEDHRKVQSRKVHLPAILALPTKIWRETRTAVHHSRIWALQWQGSFDVGRGIWCSLTSLQLDRTLKCMDDGQQAPQTVQGVRISGGIR
jgi:hypothetical protein